MGAPGLLAVWLTPAVWLTLPALILAGGPDGLWVGLAAVVAPLVAVLARVRQARSGDGGPVPLFHVAVLFLVVAGLIWANLVVVGDLVGRLGAPRWHGIAIAAAGGLLLTAWRGAERVTVPLLVVTLGGAVVPLLLVALASGISPVGAWGAVASRTGFHFARQSHWVTEGRDLRLAHGHTGIVFDEEHRITVSGEGTLRLYSKDGGSGAEREWKLSPGQSILARPGDRLEPAPGMRVRFEADKRVPGAPPSGIAWAAGRRVQARDALGLAVTLMGGAIALLAPALPPRPSRLAVGLLGSGLVLALFWAQGWAIYAALGAPDVFLGGVTAEGLLDVPRLVLGESAGALRLQGLLLVGAFASFLASTIALRGRVARVDAPGGGEIGRDLGLWAMAFGGAGVASLWPVDPWPLVLLVLGAAASALAPAVLLPRHGNQPRAATLAGCVGLTVFALLAAAGSVRGRALDGLLAVAAGSPAVAALPAALGVLWLAGRRAPE